MEYSKFTRAVFPLPSLSNVLWKTLFVFFLSPFFISTLKQKLIRNFIRTTSLELDFVNFNICGISEYEKDSTFFLKHLRFFLFEKVFNHPVLIFVLFSWYFNLKVKKTFIRRPSVDGLPKGFELTKFQFLNNGPFHSSILP